MERNYISPLVILSVAVGSQKRTNCEVEGLFLVACQAGYIRLGFLADVALKSTWVDIAGHSACRLPCLSVSADGGVLFDWCGRKDLDLQPAD